MSSTYKQGRIPIHEAGFKIAVAREYLTSNLGYGQLASKYGLKLTTVRFFVKWYKDQYPLLESDAEPQSEKEPSANDISLQKQLKEANLKITALEMLIENAHKELGVDIIKKPGTKQ